VVAAWAVAAVWAAAVVWVVMTTVYEDIPSSFVNMFSDSSNRALDRAAWVVPVWAAAWVVAAAWVETLATA